MRSYNHTTPTNDTRCCIFIFNPFFHVFDWLINCCPPLSSSKMSSCEKIEPAPTQKEKCQRPGGCPLGSGGREARRGWLETGGIEAGGTRKFEGGFGCGGAGFELYVVLALARWPMVDDAFGLAWHVGAETTDCERERSRQALRQFSRLRACMLPSSGDALRAFF